ncbi:MAG: hypothetical protein UV79_C0014G0004 [candidate division TM6 bacterium GW2011_GWF2_43_17]|nr:MAG: hypothetical protein UV79_C0014G0004 [candidate division TM6 bacterium GW2011_GWF2_43_17]HAU30543.1 hypothetical protein [Candidatus Dependentiae bacterium]
MLSLLLAKKLFFPFCKNKKWNKLIFLVCLTLAFAIAALSITGALLEAFHQETKKTFQSIQSDLFVLLPQNADQKNLSQIFSSQFSTSIRSFAFASEAPVIVANPEQQKFSTTQLVTRSFSGSKSPYQLPATCTREDFILPDEGNVIIGATLAQELGVQQGDNILVCTQELFSDPENIDWDAATLCVQRIITSGIEEIDSSLLLCNQATFNKTTKRFTPNRLDIALASKQNHSEAAQKISGVIGFQTHSWIDLYPTLQSALNLETSIFWLVIILVMAIIVLSLPSLLILLIEQKKASISILLVSGVPLSSIRYALHLFGFLLIALAQLIGLGCTAILCAIANTYRLIPLPPNYYHAYIHLSLPLCTSLIIISTSTILGGLVVWCTGRTLSHTKISYFLKKGL